MQPGLVYDPIYLEHDTGEHVENSQRLVSIMSHLEETKTKEKLTSFSPRLASIDEIQMVHAPEYVSYIKSKAESGGGWLDPDTVMCPRSYEVALYAAGGMLTAVEKVMTGEVDSAFALVRPPGHHATSNRAMGFCIFNNIAIGAKFALANFNIERILIVDLMSTMAMQLRRLFTMTPRSSISPLINIPFTPGLAGWMKLEPVKEKDIPLIFPCLLAGGMRNTSELSTKSWFQ
jgi:hypothetical protein